ncbi:restriction endonuclease subunit S [Exiguobacterium sp. s102]|uniref:restriction endonuclease subunit S n=1 Tax=Exiguobacterium sp. s102 TaxID=2751212 RepID=UPI001BEAE37D|nr:restriction endonuclease subunit S [Exiguobacterium sp. s102]
MNAQKLKKSILKYAFEGNLVTQIQDSESSIDLLNIINQEKNALIQQKKLKAEQLDLTVLEKEIPYDIPEKWTWVKLGAITEKIHYGYTASSNPNSGESKLLRITDIQNNTVEWEDVPYCEISENNISKFCLIEGDILIARTGGTIGKSYLISEIPLEIPAVFASYLIRVQSSSSLYKEYISYYLQSELYWEQLRNMSAGTGQPNVNAQNLKKLLLPFPPLNEQIKIVNKIKELFSKVEFYDSYFVELDTLNKHFPKKLEKSILQYAIQGKLVEQDISEKPASELLKQISEQKEQMVKEKVIKKEKPMPPITEEEIPFDIPETWQWVRLGEICVTNIGVTYKPGSITTKEDLNSIPVLRSSNIQNSLIDLKDLVYVNSKIRNNQFLHPGDILMCVRNGSPKLVGKTAIVNCSGMAFGAFMSKVSSPINDYLQIFFQSNIFKDQLVSSKTTTINQITQSVLKNILVPIPPLEEQKRIIFATNNILNKFKEKSQRVF